jgi:hypothetical protein
VNGGKWRPGAAQGGTFRHIAAQVHLMGMQQDTSAAFAHGAKPEGSALLLEIA